jgi:hypothetical protein
MDLNRIFLLLFFTFFTGIAGAFLGSVLGSLAGFIGYHATQRHYRHSLLPQRPMWHAALYGAALGAFLLSLWLTYVLGLSPISFPPY